MIDHVALARAARRLAPTLAMVALAACGSSMPNFGGLVADARTLHVSNDLQVVQVTNGMKVVLAPDHRTNLVSVDVRYDVGAAEDPQGRAGLAHLIEHLTFAAPGTGDGATLYDELATVALSFNAYTNHDVTHYTATALASRVDALLELEARRMELDCTRIPPALFARDRDVVLAEEAERRTPWTDTIDAMNRAVWGPKHPYGRPVGSREVADATQDEACAFHRAYYAPDRAVLVVSGDIDPATLTPRIGRRFGPIAKRATGALVQPLEPDLDGESGYRGDVEHPTVFIWLPAPPRGGEDEATHDLILDALGGELAELDDETPWVVSADAGYGGDGRRRATVIAVEVTDTKYVDRAVAEVLRRGRELFEDADHDGRADDADDPDDLVVRRRIAAFRGRRQTRIVVDGDRFEGRGIALADYMTYAPELTFSIGELEATDALTGTRLTSYAQAFFQRASAHVATVLPTGGGKAAARPPLARGARTYDLEPWRSPVDASEASRPLALATSAPALAVEELQLGNGLRVLLHADPASPIVDARLVYPVGAIDEPDDERGIAQVAAGMLEHDFDRLYPGEVGDKLNWAMSLGTQLRAGAGDDVTVFAARGLSVYADWHVWRLAWLLDQGLYRAASVRAFRQDVREADNRASSPSGRAFARKLYGPHHPYAREPAGADALARLGVTELGGWRRSYFVPEGATLVVSGGFDPAAMRREVGKLFGGWKKRAPAARAPIPSPAPAPGPSWIGTRMADAGQVTLYVSFAAATDAERDRAARAILAAVIEDRLRMVRERLGASYGTSARYAGIGPGAFHVTTSLEPDRAVEAAQAVLAELAAVRAQPASIAAELVRARRRLVGEGLATVTDAGAVADRLEWVVRHGGKLEAADRLAAALAAVTLDDVAAVARRDLDPARMVVSVDGPATEVKATLDALGATGVDWFDE